MTDPKRIACFFSTSGHSGVDRAAKHLIPAFARRGYRVDLLKVRGHGPELQQVPEGVEIIDLGSRYTYSCLPEIVRYLRRKQPVVMLSDKDKVNRTALAARLLARSRTRLVFRSGTTISIDLATRGPIERWIQRSSMRRLYPYADRVIVPSAGAADDLTEFSGLPRGHIQIVPPPVVPRTLLEAELPRPDHPWLGSPNIPLILRRTARNPRRRTLRDIRSGRRRCVPRRGLVRNPHQSAASGEAPASCLAVRGRSQRRRLSRGDGLATLRPARAM